MMPPSILYLLRFYRRPSASGDGVVDVPICPSCGKVNREGANYCAFCAAPFAPAAAPRPVATTAASPVPAPPPTADACFGTPAPRPRGPAFPGILSFAFFLIIVGVVFLSNPGIFTDVEAWLKAFTPTGGVPRPPQSLIMSAVLFFAAAGVSDFVTAGIRFAITKHRRRVLADVMTGIGWVALSGLTNLYAGQVVSGPVVIASELVVCGLLIITYLVAVSRWPVAGPPMV